MKTEIEYLKERDEYLLTHDGRPAAYLSKEDMQEIFDFIKENFYAAVKVWSKENIGYFLEKSGFKTSEENVNKVLKSPYISNLNAPNENDWNLIDMAIREAEYYENLEREV